MRNYLVIGGGIIGCSVARQLLLSKRGRVRIVEKEQRLGVHASGRNSGVIHSGINQKPGSIKARMCVEGSRLLRQFCRGKKVPLRECGTMVVARTSEEYATLTQLMDMGRTCGVEGLQLLSAPQMREIEPRARGFRALLAPTGAVVDSEKLIETLGREVVSLGGEINYGEEVIGIDRKRIVTLTNLYQADHIINCAGLYADKIAHMDGEGLDCKIIPFRGEYLEVHGAEVNSMIYQAPDLRFPFLSVHLTRFTDGTVAAGPTAVLSFGRESYDKQINPGETADFLLDSRFYLLATKPAFLAMAAKAFKLSVSPEAFRREVAKLIGPVLVEQVRPYRSGIRAQMVDKGGNFVQDLLVVFKDTKTHVLNCVSPGMTCSLAFARYIDENIHN
ncbi:MAG: L-2-hydroxyglutarate oxidase [Chitinivibrionales bacterium]|nr:L-2-hydroxyglutarate oxidase [Chitinivibrionales bacterium]